MAAMKQEQEMESLKAAYREREAGVAELMEFYDSVEEIYIEASASVYVNEVVYTSDSTNIGANDADVGPTSTRTQ